MLTRYPDGTSCENEYDDGGRLIKQTDRNGNIVLYEYDDSNNVTKTTNALGGITLNEYDANGNLIKTTNPSGNITRYEYNANDKLSKIINAMNGETVYTYNKAGELISVADPLGNTTTNTYNIIGQLVTVTDPKGNKTDYTYDQLGNLITVKNALGEVTTNTYDDMNRLISSKDPGGHITTYSYDELGRQILRIDARGNMVHYYYDELGNIIKIINESGHVDFEAVYDNCSRAIEVTDVAGNKTTNTYDWAGNLTQQKDALNNICSYTYNSLGKMVSAVDKDGKNSYATYDGMGNLTSMTGPMGSVVGYTYNIAGQMIEKDALPGASYTYNALGLIQTLTKNEGGTTTYTYDIAGRLTGFVDMDNTASYTYDANGNVLTASDDVGTVSREYDALNRVTKYTDINGRVIQYEYDSCGNLKKMTYPNGEYGTYTYDANHNMITSSMFNGSASKSSTYEYNSQNQITKINNPDGSVVTKTYNSAGRLIRLKDVDENGQIIVNDTYLYDKLGRITMETSSKSMCRYLMQYDNLGRLTMRTEYDISGTTAIKKNEELFTYDAAGNITSDTSGGKTNTYTYGTDNDICSMNNNYFDIDYNGNLLGCPMYKGSRNSSVTYDSKNRLTHFNGDTYSYLYDVENNRINMYAAGTNTMYTYDCSDGRHRLVWTKNHNLVETTYAYGADGLMWSSSNGEYSIFHYDYRGSVVAVTDIDGNVTATAKYDAYGYIISKTGSGDRTIGYNGRDGVLTDPDGLLYMRARYYSPVLKRFLNCDIIDGSIEDSTTLNLYAYVNGNPISFVDPFGMSAERGDSNNVDIISGLKGLYGLAYSYYNTPENSGYVQRYANDAVLKYIISERFYEASVIKGLAWSVIAGPVDKGAQKYLENYIEYDYLKTAVFIDPSSGAEIDFVHLMATLNAIYYYTFSLDDSLENALNAYAGWAGDLITLAGDVQESYTFDSDVVQTVKEFLSDPQKVSHFSNSDLLADIDAVLIADYMYDTPIYEAIETYYSDSYKSRYALFLDMGFNGSQSMLENSAEGYLAPGNLTNIFKTMFGSSYSESIYPYVAKGFAEYIAIQAGR